MEKETMTPSDKPMTNGQIAKLAEVIAAKLRKAEIPSEPSQIVLGNSKVINSMVGDFVSEFEKQVSAVSGIIIKHVYIDGTRTPQEVLDATGRKQFIDSDVDVVANMPRGEGGRKKVYLVPFSALSDKYKEDGEWISDEDLEKALNELDFRSADPYSQAQVHIDDPSFADKYSNGTHWIGGDGKWCAMDFDRDGLRGVTVYSSGHRRHGVGWYFAAEKIPDGPL